MDAISMLEKQHREVDELFDRLRRMGNGGTAGRRKIFLELADALELHSAIEERCFYPSVKADDTELIVQHSVWEHLEVKRVLAELLNEGISDDDFDQKLEELQGLVGDHVQEEETELFPRVRQLLDDETLEALAQEMTITMIEIEQEGPPRENVYAETERPAEV